MITHHSGSSLDFLSQSSSGPRGQRWMLQGLIKIQLWKTSVSLLSYSTGQSKSQGQSRCKRWWNNFHLLIGGAGKLFSLVPHTKYFDPLARRSYPIIVSVSVSKCRVLIIYLMCNTDEMPWMHFLRCSSSEAVTLASEN